MFNTPDMPDELLKRFGARVRALRLASQLTQQELADRAGLHFTYIARVEAGGRNASIASLGKLAKGLGVSLSALMEDVDA